MVFKHFGEGIIKGMVVVFEHLFKKMVTTQYPEQRLNTSRRIRGTELGWSVDNCVACLLCESACPHGCIKIETEGRKQVTVFRLDGGCCIYCGLCVEACKFNALYMGRGYERSCYRLAQTTFEKEDLAVNHIIEPSAYNYPELEEGMPVQTLLVEGKIEG